MKHLLIAALVMRTAAAFQVQITIYDKATLPENIRREAANELRRVFGQAKIDVQLVTGNPSSEEATTMNYPGRVLSGREKGAACECSAVHRPGRCSFLASWLGRRRARTGSAVSSNGLNIRVFGDHVADAAIRQNRTHGIVLAYAIAHEIGHVLLRSNAHADWGIMSGLWRGQEYERMARGQLRFTRAQTQTMLATLRGEGCPVATGRALPGPRAIGLLDTGSRPTSAPKWTRSRHVAEVQPRDQAPEAGLKEACL